MAEQKQPKITTAGQWRHLRERGQVVVLPSGAVVRLRPISLTELIKTGHIPNELMKFALKIANGKDDELTKEALLDGELVLDIMCEHMILEPKFTPDPKKVDDDTTLLNVMPEADKSFIYSWGMSPTIDFKSFRKK